MNRYLGRFAVSVGILVALSCVWPTESYAADAVICVNCGTETTQLLNKLQVAEQLATQAEQLKTQISQYENMLLNTKVLPTQLWGRAMQDFRQLTGLMQQSRSLAFTARNLGSQFASRYGTYNSYLNQRMGANTWQNKYSQWSKEAHDNTLYTMQGLGLQASQMNDEQAALQRIQGMATSADGQMQALQVANMMAGQNVDQVMKLRQLIMMQAQMQANYLAQLEDRRAAELAAKQNYFQVHKATLNGERF